MQYFSYGFDTEKGKCVQFMYGGCKGNKNNFVSLENCQKECKGKGPKLDKSKKIVIINKAKPLTKIDLGPKPALSGTLNKASSTNKEIAEVKKSIEKKVMSKQVKEAFAKAKTEKDKKKLKEAIEKHVSKAIKKAIVEEKIKRDMKPLLEKPAKMDKMMPPVISKPVKSDKMKPLKDVIVAKKVEMAIKKLKEEKSNPCTLPIEAGLCKALKKR